MLRDFLVPDPGGGVCSVLDEVSLNPEFSLFGDELARLAWAWFVCRTRVAGEGEAFLLDVLLPFLVCKKREQKANIFKGESGTEKFFLYMILLLSL